MTTKYNLKSNINLFIPLFLLLFLFAPSNVKADFDGGNGTSVDPYQISTCVQLQEIENDLGEDGDETFYELTGNIDCSDTVNWNDGAGFDPLGDPENPAHVDFGGQGVTTYNITGLYINRPNEDYVGLFGYTADVTYMDRVRLVDAQITGRNYVGGLVGQNFGDVAYVQVSGEVTGEAYVGGLFGLFSKGTAQINGVDVDVEGDSHVGGAVGWMADDSNSSLWRVYSVGAVYANEEYAGGLVGRMYDLEGGNAMYIYDSYSLGPVVGRDYVGGLVGSAEGNLSDRIRRSYSAGLVASPGGRVGGLVGNGSGGASSLDSFWDTETSGQSTSALDETGKTTAQMTNVVTFTETDTEGLASAWDFVGNPNDDASNNNYWTIDSEENDGYPYLNIITDGAPDVSSVFLMYYADPNRGTLAGSKLQRLSDGGNGSEVSASPGPRNRFSGWNDGNSGSVRTDLEVNEDAIYIANFSSRGSRREVSAPVPTSISSLTFLSEENSIEYETRGYAPLVNIHTFNGEIWRLVERNVQNSGRYEFKDSDLLGVITIKLELTDLAVVLDSEEVDLHVNNLDEKSADIKDEETEYEVSEDDDFTFPSEALSPFSGLMEPVDQVEPGDLIRGENYTTVYLITEDYKRRPFWNEAIYATYYDSFDDVVEVTDATLGVLKLGNPMMPNPETVLVKVLSLSDVSLPVMVDFADVRRKVPSEAVASSLFGNLWADYVIDLPVGVHRWYTEGNDLSEADSVDRTRLRRRVELNIR